MTRAIAVLISSALAGAAVWLHPSGYGQRDFTDFIGVDGADESKIAGAKTPDTSHKKRGKPSAGYDPQVDYGVNGPVSRSVGGALGLDGGPLQSWQELDPESLMTSSQVDDPGPAVQQKREFVPSTATPFYGLSPYTIFGGL